MLELDALRILLQSKAIAVTTANTFACRIGNEPFKQPQNGALFGEFWFRTGKTIAIELNGPKGYEVTAGVLQFTIYAPENSGDGPSLKLAGALKHYFNKKNWQVPPDGYVVIDPVSVKPVPGNKGGPLVTIVDATFNFFHRNPDATPD